MHIVSTYKKSCAVQNCPNTIEAGIVFDDSDKFEYEPPKTYPGKLCKFLYTRYVYFHGAIDKGLVILPVELIDDNGVYLKSMLFNLQNAGS